MNHAHDKDCIIHVWPAQIALASKVRFKKALRRLQARVLEADFGIFHAMIIQLLDLPCCRQSGPSASNCAHVSRRAPRDKLVAAQCRNYRTSLLLGALVQDVWNVDHCEHIRPAQRAR